MQQFAQSLSPYSYYICPEPQIDSLETLKN